MKIGGQKGRRPYLTPENSSMGNRANTSLEHLVAAANVRHEQALRVDGVPVLIWRKTSTGSKPCTCCKPSTTASHNLMFATSGSVGSTDINDTGDNSISDYSILGVGSPGPARPERENSIRMQTHTATETPTNRATSEDDEDFAYDGDSETESLNIRNTEFNGHPDPFEYVDLPEDMSDRTPSTNGTIDSYITGDNIRCPVCIGTNYVNSWQPVGAVRVVMSFLDSDTFETDGYIDANATPNCLTLEPGQFLEFSVKLPKYFTSVEKIGMFNMRNSANGGELKLKQLDVLKNATPKTVLHDRNGVGGETTFRFEATSRTLITHFDSVLRLSDPTYAQFPPLSLPYEREYLETNTSVSVEFSASVEAQPGDVVIDYKHKRTWKITNANPKSSAEGRSLQFLADMRLVNQHEVLACLSVFEMPVSNAEKPFQLVNSKFQSGKR